MYREIFQVPEGEPERDPVSDDDVVIDRCVLSSTTSSSTLDMDIVISEMKPNESKRTWLVVMWPDDTSQNNEKILKSLKTKYCIYAYITYISPLQNDKRLTIYMEYGGYLIKFQPSYDKLSELSGLMVGSNVFVSISYAVGGASK